MNKEKAIKDCEMKISDECFRLNEFCKTFKTAELKKFKGIERYREMLKIASQIASIDERIWNLYEKIPDENKLKKDKIVLLARDEAKQVREIMEMEDDPRKKYILSYDSKQFNTWKQQSTPKFSRSVSISTMNLKQQLSANAVSTSSQSTPNKSILKKSSSSPNLLRGPITYTGNTRDSVEIYSDLEISNYFETESNTSNDSIFSSSIVPQPSTMDENTAIQVNDVNHDIDIELEKETVNKEAEEEDQNEKEMNDLYATSALQSSVPNDLIQQVENECATDSEHFSDSSSSSYTDIEVNDMNTIPDVDLNKTSYNKESTTVMKQDEGDNTNDSVQLQDIKADEIHISITKPMSDSFVADNFEMLAPMSTISQITILADSKLESENLTSNEVHNETNFYDESSKFDSNPIENDFDGIGESESKDEDITASKVFESNAMEEQEEEIIPRPISPQLSLEFLFGTV